MKNEVHILVAEDEDGHARLIERNLVRAGLTNPITRFRDGQEAVDFLFGPEGQQRRERGQSWLLLLDIRMPKLDGVSVLRRVKADATLRRMPVIMLTTTDEPREVARCHELGCAHYITKPVDYQRFVEVIRQLGMFLTVVEVPSMRD